jgi:hypothetical protein
MLPVQLVAKVGCARAAHGGERARGAGGNGVCLRQPQHHLVEEEVLRGQVTDALRDAVFEVATAASDHLLAARSLAVAAAVPPAARRALLPAVRRPFPATLSVYSR